MGAGKLKPAAPANTVTPEQAMEIVNQRSAEIRARAAKLPPGKDRTILELEADLVLERGTVSIVNQVMGQYAAQLREADGFREKVRRLLMVRSLEGSARSHEVQLFQRDEEGRLLYVEKFGVR